jgi:hypothetical protein
MVWGQGLAGRLGALSLALTWGCSTSVDLEAVMRVDVFAGERWFIALGRPALADVPASAVVIASDGARLSPGEVVEGALFVAERPDDVLRACTAADPKPLVGARLASDASAATLVLPCVPLSLTASAAPPLALAAPKAAPTTGVDAR